MKRTYLFDFDGTLVDSMPTFVSVMLKILDKYGIKYESDIVKTITPLGYVGTAEYFQGLGIQKSIAELVDEMNKYAYEEYANNILAKDGVDETLTKLKSRGDSLSVLTASPHIMLDPCLKRLGILELFDNVWSCDDFKTTKSTPEIYKMAAEKMSCCTREVIFVDDNINAVKTAKTAGMKAYGIFDASSEEYIDEMKAVSDRYIKSFKDLLDN